MKNRNLVEETITALKKYIDDQKMIIGTKLPTEKVLAEKFNVGRSTLREAVKILQYAEVLEVKQGSGTFVKQTNDAKNWVKDLMEARETIEIAAAKLACLNRSEEELFSLNQALFKRNRLLAMGKFSDYIEADLIFHQLIVNASHNLIYIRWYEELQPILKNWLSQLAIDPKSYQDNTKAHEEIFHGILIQNQEEVVNAIIKNNRSNHIDE